MKPPTMTTNGSTTTSKVHVTIPAIDIRTIHVPIEGLSPLICNRFDAATMDGILDKQKGKAVGPRKKKDVDALFRSRLYHINEENETYGFPSNGFKQAMTRASKKFMAMTDFRGRVFVKNELTEIIGEPTVRHDVVKLQGSKTDIRIRPEFKEWSAILEIDYEASSISEEEIVNIVNHAGFSVGIGEWRPERNGIYGRFTVK